MTIQYRDGKKTLYYYNVSDIAFDDSEVLTMIQEVNQGGFRIIALSESFTHLLSIGENRQPKSLPEIGSPSEIVDSCVVDFEQRMVNNSPSTVQNRQLLNIYRQTNKEKQNKEKQTFVNLQATNEYLNAIQFKVALISACNEFYSEFAPSRWSKQAWLTLIETFVNEKIEDEAYIRVPADKIKAYAYSSIKNMAHKFDMKNGKIEFSSSGEIPYYDWLNQ